MFESKTLKKPIVVKIKKVPAEMLMQTAVTFTKTWKVFAVNMLHIPKCTNEDIKQRTHSFYYNFYSCR